MNGNYELLTKSKFYDVMLGVIIFGVLDACLIWWLGIGAGICLMLMLNSIGISFLKKYNCKYFMYGVLLLFIYPLFLLLGYGLCKQS
jgi:hypothetical protein